MDERTWLIIYVVIGWLTAIVIEIQCNHWKRKHDEAITAWTIESNNKDKQILKLQEKLENLKEISVKHGRWLYVRGEWWKCSSCGQLIYSTSESDRQIMHAYCSRCGTRMDGGSDE